MTALYIYGIFILYHLFCYCRDIGGGLFIEREIDTKRKIGMRLIGIVCICIMCMGMTTVASASKNPVCTHPNTKQYGSTVASWSSGHWITLSDNDGPQWCSYTHWVDELETHCTSCDFVLYRDSIHHERHSLCNMSIN